MKFDPWLERYRIAVGPYASPRSADYGAFHFPGPCGADLHVIASPGDANGDIPWEHVSVSLAKRTPNWKEMCFVKGLFWDDEETVMQLHPPKSTWINNHPHCLHLWKPTKEAIPLPPSVSVGYKELNLESEMVKES